MARTLQRLTVEESLNAMSPHTAKWKVHDLYTWINEDSSDVTLTKHVDVSDLYSFTIQCGDFMYISFTEQNDNIALDGKFSNDVATGVDGSFWKLSSADSWNIKGGKAIHVSGDSGHFFSQVRASSDGWDLTTNTTYLIKYTISEITSNSFYVRAGWGSRGKTRTNGGYYSEYLKASEANFYLHANGGANCAIDDLQVIPTTNINKSTDFIIAPGMWTLKVPKGLGDKIDFNFLPYSDSTAASNFMRVVEH